MFNTINLSVQLTETFHLLGNIKNLSFLFYYYYFFFHLNNDFISLKQFSLFINYQLN